MAASQGGGEAAFVGRQHELELLQSLIEGARSGTAGMVLVSGDAGVGKTALVTKACAAATEGGLVLSGGALPLASTAVPLLALRSAVRCLPAAERPAVLSSAGPSELMPGTPVLFDEWLEYRSRTRPVVLALDDLHWADQSTLDVLLYVLAGPGDRRIALLATVRREEVGEDHPLQRWLADARRLPLYSELALGPLDRSETREQLAGLLGAPPHETLVGEVFARTRGNAYLNRLLVAGLDPDARHVARDLPTDLRTAVLHSWHTLSPPARELVRVLAVGGQVADGRRLWRATELAGTPEPTPLLREALDAGILDVTPDGGYWFHHPLQAEALEAGLAPEERRRLHAAWATSAERDHALELADETADLETVTVIADHHYRASHLSLAYAWALRAVEVAEATGGATEQLRLLERALRLRRQLPRAGESVRELLELLRRLAERLGEHEQELQAVEGLLELHDESSEPLVVAELIVRREHLRFSTGRDFFDTADLRRAVALTAQAPASWQHALALAGLAEAALWGGDPGAPALAEQALTLAEAVGDPRALAYALTACAMEEVFSDHVDEASAHARAAVGQAVKARDNWAFVHAALWEANAVDTPVNPAWGALVSERRRQLQQLGAPHPYVAWLSSDEAESALYAGRWQQCAERLRLALGSDPGAYVDVKTRLTAARLATLQGRQRDATAHLARAEEVCVHASSFLPLAFDATRALVLLGAGDRSGAIEAALSGASQPGAPPTMCEWLLPLAARGLADEVQVLRDSGRRPEAPLSRLVEVVEEFPHIIADLGGTTDFYTRELRGLDALYAAEVARAQGSPDAVRAWVAAAALLEGILPWEEAYAAWRAAEAQLAHTGGRREEAAAMLRRAHSLAQQLGAAPVLREVEDLARSARISLAPVEPSSGSDRVPARLDGLTTREWEILEYIVAGRTYGEIARALVLSEKTVSSHVSNLLRKTGAANRVDLARLATHGPSPPIDGVSG